MTNELITEETIWLNMSASSREDVVRNICGNLFISGKTQNPAGLFADIIKREAIVSTFAGSLTAIPHTITGHINEPTLCFARIDNDEFTWNGSGEDVRFVFFSAVPEKGDLKSLRESQSYIFSAIAQLIGKVDTLNLWKEVNDKKIILNSLNEALSACRT